MERVLHQTRNQDDLHHLLGTLQKHYKIRHQHQLPTHLPIPISPTTPSNTASSTNTSGSGASGKSDGKGCMGISGVGMMFKEQLDMKRKLEALESEVAELKKQRVQDQEAMQSLDRFQLGTVKELKRLSDYVARK